MSSEDRDSTGSDSEGEGPNMMNFMFGNVDADGNLEGDFLDEETKQQLAGLQNSKDGLDISSIVDAPRGGTGPSAAPGVTKKANKDADTVGESDLSDDEDWLADALEADEAKPQPHETATGIAAQPGSSTAAPAPAAVAPAMTAVLPPLAQHAVFEEEDDYDDEDMDEVAPVAPASSTLPIAHMASPAVHAVPAAPATLPSSAPTAAPVMATATPPAAAGSFQAQTAAAIGHSGNLQLPTVVPQSLAAQPTASLPVVAGHAAVQGQMPVSGLIPEAAALQLQPSRRREVTVKEQRREAAEKGATLPVLMTSNGECILKYSDLMSSTTFLLPHQTGDSEATARAKLRAERLNALQAQSMDKEKASATAAAAKAEDSDDESFFHMACKKKLPEHLVDSSAFSQDSDTDAVTHEVDSREHHTAQTDKSISHQVKQPALHTQRVKAKTGQVLWSGEGLVLGPDAPTFTPVPDTDFDPVHIVQWERNIVWDQQDESPDAPVIAAPLAEDDWAEFDRELGYGSTATQRQLQAQHTSRAAVLEALPPRPAKGPNPAPTAHLHPQMLRLEELVLDDQQQPAAQLDPLAVPAAAEHHAAPSSGAAASVRVPLFSQQLTSDTWLGEVQWGGDEDGSPQGSPPSLLLDMNDPQMTFEVLRGTSVEVYANAAAMVLPAMPKVQPTFGNPIVHSSAGAIMARFNISKDAIYFPAGKRKGDKAGGGSRLHTVQATNFNSIPLKTGTRAEMFHRPMGLWNPLVSRKIHVKNQDKLQIDEMQVKLSSLVGGNPEWHSQDPLTLTFKKVSAAETLQALWDKAKEDKFKGAVFRNAAGNVVTEHIPYVVDRRNPMGPIDLSAPLQSTVLKEPVLEFAAIFSSIKLLPTGVANAVPSPSSGAALAPPAAFQKRKDLTATEGHVVLLEYFEEYPLLLGHAGMGARLTTYHRRSSATDTSHQRLVKEHDKWKVGKLELLQPADDSPFLGQIEEGQSQLAVETGMYRAPGFAYSTSASDFLLVRNAAGVIMLRELTGCIAVGQEVPMIRAPIPMSRDVREIEAGRMVVHVVRELRSKQAKAEKNRAKSGSYVPPKVSIKELKQIFPCLSDATARLRLKDKCECIPVRAEYPDDWWQLKDDARLPSEAELRRSVSPDQWCALDSTKSGLHRLWEMGSVKHQELSSHPVERIQIAIEQLPEEKQAAARQLDLAIRSTPWALTHNYIHSERETKGVQVEFAGPGDPTGKGRGFSFVRDIRRAAVQNAKQKEGKLTGTSADLRRLKVDALKLKLKEAGVPEEYWIKGRRWELVDLLRAIAGAGAGDQNFARNQRMSAAELQARKHRLCQEIWQRQVAVLSNVPEQQAEDSVSEDDIGEELKASLTSNEAESAPPQAEEDEARLSEAQQEAEDAAELEAMRESGMLSGDPAAASAPKPAAAPKKKLEAEPGARRLRRIITYTKDDGEKVVKEVVYYQGKDEDKVVALNALYGMQPWNFGSRIIKGRTGTKARGIDKTASQLKAEPMLAALRDDTAVGMDAAAVAMDAAAMAEPMVMEPEWEPTAARRPPIKKGAPKKAVGKMGKKSGQVQICRDCGLAGHISKNNKKCLVYEPPLPKDEMMYDAALMAQDPLTAQAIPAAAPTPSRIKVKLNASSKCLPATSTAAVAATGQATASSAGQHATQHNATQHNAALQQQQAEQQQQEAARKQQEAAQKQQEAEKQLAEAQQQKKEEQQQQKEAERQQQLLQQEQQRLKQQEDAKLQQQQRDEQAQQQQALVQQQRQQEEEAARVQEQQAEKRMRKEERRRRKEEQKQKDALLLQQQQEQQELQRQKEQEMERQAHEKQEQQKQKMQRQEQQQAQRAAEAEASTAQPSLSKKRHADDVQPADEAPAKKLRVKLKVTAPAGAAGYASAPVPNAEPAQRPSSKAGQVEQPRMPKGQPKAPADRDVGPSRLPHEFKAQRDSEGPKQQSQAARDLPQGPPRRPQSAAGPSAAAPAAAPARPAAPPKKGVPKKQGLTGKRKLAKVLSSVFAEIKRRVLADKACKAHWDIFSVPVSKKIVYDYNKFVSEADEMWMKKINGKLTRSQYSSRQEFDADVHQITKNARAYNYAYHQGAVCANPVVVPTAELIYEACKDALLRYAAELSEAEQQVQLETV